MDAHYGTTMPSLGAFYPGGHPPIMPPPPQESFQPRLHPLQTYSMEHMGPYSDIDDPNQTMVSPQQGSQRARRRQASGSEHVKHKRTRSGCFTCRTRRVKCDESRPKCERCRKGKRDCSYPDPAAKGGRRESKSKSTSADSESSPSGDEDDDGKRVLSVIPDDEENLGLDASNPASATASSGNYPDSTTLSNSKNTLPLTEASSVLSRQVRPQAARTSSRHSVKPSISHNARWSTLPKDVKYYLTYHKENMSKHHYGLKSDSGRFLKTTFLEIAMNDQSQALLYAIVAFSCYHNTVAQEDPRISTFLSYYNKSIILLQQSLKSKKPSVTTLLTILQLATIEEFLGDWVNLLGHQRAAQQILTDLFTPQTITQDETRRRIITWYIRFELFAGIMSGNATTLSRDWFAACQEHYQRQSKDRPEDLSVKFEEFFSTTRLLSADLTLLFARMKKGAISDDEIAKRTRDLLGRFANFGHTLETSFADPSNYVKSFPNAPPPSEDDITDYRDPNFLLAGELFTMNYVRIEFWALDLMFKHRLTLAQQQAPSVEMTQLALKKCKMFEAIESCDEGPPAVLGCQASLGMAAMFLPKDEKHTDWCRRKFALIERLGYIYPPSLRQHMSDLWGVDVNRWWLQNDEGYPGAVRAVRDFIEYRAQIPKDTMDAHVRDMSGIFQTMKVEEHSSISTDSDQFSPNLAHESSPEQAWPG